MTPILAASKYNNLECATLLFDSGANIYVTDNKMQNVLHYSIINENENMIKFFISKDEKLYLRNEQNAMGKSPIDLKKAQPFM